MSHRSDHVFRSERRVASKKYAGMGRCKSFRINLRNIGFIEFYSKVAFYPWEAVLLAYRYQHVIGLNKNVSFACWNQLALSLFIDNGFYFFEGHARQFTVFNYK